MAVMYVVGLFASKGIAEDACNRLRTEGVAARDIALEVLRRTAPVGDVGTVQAEIAALDVDPLVVNARESFAAFIRNGETGVFVRAPSEADVELAAGTLHQYAPIRIQVVWIENGTAVKQELRWPQPG